MTELLHLIGFGKLQGPFEGAADVMEAGARSQATFLAAYGHSAPSLTSSLRTHQMGVSVNGGDDEVAVV